MKARSLAVVAILVAAAYFYTQNSQDTTPETDSQKAASVITPHIAWETEETIKPTAIVLHWWALDGGGDIDKLVRGAEGNRSTFNSELNSTDPHPEVGHVTVQVGVTKDGKSYQLTPKLNSFARHATCANRWAIGIEIEGSEPGSGVYIGDNQKQFEGVVAAVRQLMDEFDIPAESVVNDRAKSGRGIVSHKMVDAKCTWKDGKPAGSGKSDVDDKYLKRVIDAVRG